MRFELALRLHSAAAVRDAFVNKKTLHLEGFLPSIAGAGLIPNPATVDGPQTGAIAHRVEESCSLG
jgi:hypothetical protein